MFKIGRKSVVLLYYTSVLFYQSLLVFTYIHLDYSTQSTYFYLYLPIFTYIYHIFLPILNIFIHISTYFYIFTTYFYLFSCIFLHIFMYISTYFYIFTYLPRPDPHNSVLLYRSVGYYL